MIGKIYLNNFIMKKSICFLLLSGFVMLISCESGWVVKDKNGSLGKTDAPVAKSFSLTQNQVVAAQDGRLVVTENSTSNFGAEKVIPVQFEILSPDTKSQAVMLLPDGESGKRSFRWFESKTKLKNTMEVKEDIESGQIIMSDDGKPVLRYNYKTVYEKDAIDTLAANKYIVTANDTFMANPSIYAVARSNYIHPLYGLNGELLTRDWSKDHPHHRGIYWAWPEVKFGSQLGDLHALQIVFARPTGKIKLQNGPVFAQIEAENLWMWRDSIPIVQEIAIIRSYHATSKGRIIDLTFRFVGLKDSVSIARRGTKFYGGLNVRMQTPKKQVISVSTDSSNIVPLRCWSDLSGLFTGTDKSSGLMVLQHQQNPDYPGDWIQYPELSWVQPTFPAFGTRYTLNRGKSLILRFRLFIHAGNKPDNELSKMLWDVFNSDAAPKISFSFSEME